MQLRRTVRLAAAALLAAAAACAPRGVEPAPHAPEPAPPPAAPAEVREETPVERVLRARRLFDEGVLLGRQGRWSEAAARYRDAAALDSGNPTYHFALADALFAQNRDWEAADALWAAVRAEEALPAPNHRVLAVDYERLVQTLTRLQRLDEAGDARRRQARHRQLRDAAAPR
jgi:tetratricopeptide (TPR) repeat protein